MTKDFLTFRELRWGDVFCRVDGILDRDKCGGIYRKEQNGGVSRLTFVRRDPADHWNGDGDKAFKVSWMSYDAHGMLSGSFVIKLDFGRLYTFVAHPNPQ